MQKYNNLANRDQLVIATKYSLKMSTDPNSSGNHKKNLVQALNKSLERLNTNFVDILYVHYWDFTTDTEQLMRALDDVVRSGKALHVAISDAPAWEVSRANTIAQLRGWSPFTCYQGKYSLVDRSVENDVLPMCNKMNVGFVPWAIVGQGKLTGKYTREGVKGDAQRKVFNMTETEFQIQDAVIKIANEVGRSPAQVATNWVLNTPGVSSALIGPSKLDQLTDSIKALEFKLTPEQMATLNEVSKNSPGKIFPHNFIQDSYKTNPWLYGFNKTFIIE
jgi:aryl-alcohol dehydrogenase-like predicted oxidoreductase